MRNARLGVDEVDGYGRCILESVSVSIVPVSSPTPPVDEGSASGSPIRGRSRVGTSAPRVHGSSLPRRRLGSNTERAYPPMAARFPDIVCGQGRRIVYDQFSSSRWKFSVPPATAVRAWA